MKHVLMAAAVASLAGCASPAPGPGTIDTGKNFVEVSVGARSRVTLVGAIEAALARVEGQAIKAEIETEDGQTVYEIEILSGGKRYEVEIDAVTGAVLEVEEEDDDEGDEEDED